MKMFKKYLSMALAIALAALCVPAVNADYPPPMIIRDKQGDIIDCQVQQEPGDVAPVVTNVPWYNNPKIKDAISLVIIGGFIGFLGYQIYDFEQWLKRSIEEMNNKIALAEYIVFVEYPFGIYLYKDLGATDEQMRLFTENMNQKLADVVGCHVHDLDYNNFV